MRFLNATLASDQFLAKSFHSPPWLLYTRSYSFLILLLGTRLPPAGSRLSPRDLLTVMYGNPRSLEAPQSHAQSKPASPPSLRSGS